MRKSRFSEEQIIGMIKEQEAGLPTVEVCRIPELRPGDIVISKRCVEAPYGD